MTNSLLDRIDAELASQVHRVLFHAAENVGECTYAANLPAYQSARKKLREVEKNCWTLDSSRRSMREYRIVIELRHHHREMYRQPCLICEACQGRVKRWGDAAYSMFGVRRDDDVDPLFYDNPIVGKRVYPPYFAHL